MRESPVIIQMNVAHYRALLKLDMEEERRSTIKKLLEEAERELTAAVTVDATD